MGNLNSSEIITKMSEYLLKNIYSQDTIYGAIDTLIILKHESEAKELRSFISKFRYQ